MISVSVDFTCLLLLQAPRVCIWWLSSPKEHFPSACQCWFEQLFFAPVVYTQNWGRQTLWRCVCIYFCSDSLLHSWSFISWHFLLAKSSTFLMVITLFSLLQLTEPVTGWIRASSPIAWPRFPYGPRRTQALYSICCVNVVLWWFNKKGRFVSWHCFAWFLSYVQRYE